MPATEHAFSETPPVRLYVDTDALIAVLVSTEPHHERSRAFFDRFARLDGASVFLSSLTWLEFANAVMRERFRVSLPDNMARQFHLDRWQQATVRRSYLEYFLDALESFLGQFQWVEVSLTSQVRARTLRYITRANLHPNDAAHVASAVHVGVTDFVSFDEAFRRVDGLNLWNDLIHR